jgi:fatty acid desaturase
LFASAALNVLVGRVLGGLTGIDFRRFSIQHLRHHRTYGRPGDPQGFQYVGLRGMTRLQLAWHLARPLVGLNLRYAWPESFLSPKNLASALHSGDLYLFAALQLLVVAVVTDAGASWWLAPLPVASAATFGLFFSQLRGIAEHAATEAHDPRSHAPHWLDRLLLYDLNFNYHAEHHRDPQYPSCRLPAVHRERPAAPALERSMLRTLASLRAG